MSIKRNIFFVLLITSCFVFFKTSLPTPYIFSGIKLFPEMPVNKNNVTTNEGADLGRHLFYDKILSKDSTISCATCHRFEVAFSDSPNRFSVGFDGDSLSRNTPALYNLAWYSDFFWDGRSSSIEAQVFVPVSAHNEMNLDWNEAEKRINSSLFYKDKFNLAFGDVTIDSVLISKAIAQFERTLISNNSKFDQVLHGKAYLSPEEYRGYELMHNQVKGNCLHCHSFDANPLGTNLRFSNNGLDKPLSVNDYKDLGRGGITKNNKDNGFFKVPSLRNIALTAPYMHDGRFETLEEVLDFYSDDFNNSINIDSKMMFGNKKNRALSSEEKQDIISFLYTLTDSTFITNPEFMSPF